MPLSLALGPELRGKFSQLGPAPTPQSKWTGGGSTNNFSDAANWDVAPIVGSDLIFAGTTRLTPNNDATAGTVFGSVTFDNTAGAFVIGGNSIANISSIINNSSNSQQLNFPMTIAGNLNIDTETQDIKIVGVVSGAGRITKSGPSYTLHLYSTNTYSGGSNLDEGEIKAYTDNVLGSGVLATANGTTLSSGGGSDNRFDCNVVLTGTLNITCYFGGGGDYGFYGVVSGSGLINVIADGNGRRVAFRNTNTWTGGITSGVGNQFQRGTIEVYKENGFGTGPISWNQNGGEVHIFNGAGYYTLANNFITPSGAILTFYIAATLDINGTISGAGALTMYGSGTVNVLGDVTVSGTITTPSNGLQVAFNGASTLGPVVNSSLAFQAAGTVASMVNTAPINPYYIFPGIDSLANVGIIAVTGSLSFDSGCILYLVTNGGTTHSKMTAGGAVTLGGVTVTFDGALNAGTYTVINGASAMTGTATQGAPPTGRTWVSLMVVGNNLVAVFS